MFKRLVPDPDLMEQLEELENMLFDNSFNATTWTNELKSGAEGWWYGSEQLQAYLVLRELDGITDILRVGVHPDLQGRRLGTKLMLLAMKDRGRCMLTVRKDNAVALHLYKNLGFYIVGEFERSWVMATSPAAS